MTSIRFFVAAVICCESGYDKDAVSPVGRRGADADYAGYGGMDRSKSLRWKGTLLTCSASPIPTFNWGAGICNTCTGVLAACGGTCWPPIMPGPTMCKSGWTDEAYSTEGNLTQIPFEETRQFVERGDARL